MSVLVTSQRKKKETRGRESEKGRTGDVLSTHLFIFIDALWTELTKERSSVPHSSRSSFCLYNYFYLSFVINVNCL